MARSWWRAATMATTASRWSPPSCTTPTSGAELPPRTAVPGAPAPKLDPPEVPAGNRDLPTLPAEPQQHGPLDHPAVRRDRIQAEAGHLGGGSWRWGIPW